MKLFYKIEQYDGITGKNYKKVYINPLVFFLPLTVATVVWYMYGKDILKYISDLVM